jgi:hypothetical protein
MTIANITVTCDTPGGICIARGVAASNGVSLVGELVIERGVSFQEADGVVIGGSVEHSGDNPCCEYAS